MKCKPNQLAFIKVPAYYSRFGLQCLNNHVVKTVRLLGGYSEPMWEVTPTQTVVFTGRACDRFGQKLDPGDKAKAAGIPDSWLQPFDPDSEPEAQETDLSLGVPA